MNHAVAYSLSNFGSINFDWGAIIQAVTQGINVGLSVRMSRQQAEEARGRLQTQAVEAGRQWLERIQNECIPPQQAHQGIQEIRNAFLQTCQQLPVSSVAASCTNIYNEQGVWTGMVDRALQLNAQDPRCASGQVQTTPSGQIQPSGQSVQAVVDPQTGRVTYIPVSGAQNDFTKLLLPLGLTFIGVMLFMSR